MAGRAAAPAPPFCFSFVELTLLLTPPPNRSSITSITLPHSSQTGEGRPGYPALLAEALKMAGAEDGLEAVLLTHHHYDHVGGLHQVRKF